MLSKHNGQVFVTDWLEKEEFESSSAPSYPHLQSFEHTFFSLNLKSNRQVIFLKLVGKKLGNWPKATLANKSCS